MVQSYMYCYANTTTATDDANEKSICDSPVNNCIIFCLPTGVQDLTRCIKILRFRDSPVHFLYIYNVNHLCTIITALEKADYQSKIFSNPMALCFSSSSTFFKKKSVRII